MNYYLIGDTFHGSDELYHWKYIKKVKVNGKWRYYYDMKDNKLSELQAEERRAQETFDKGFNNFIKRRRSEDITRASGAYSKSDRISATNNVVSWYKNRSLMNATKDLYGSKYASYDRYKLRSAQNAVRKYRTTLSGRVDSFMQKNGRKIVRSLNNTSDSIEKAKKWVSNLFD